MSRRINVHGNGNVFCFLWDTDLNLCDDNPPGLLVQPLIVPVRIEVSQLRGKSKGG